MATVTMIGYNSAVVAEANVSVESSSTKYASADAAYTSFCSELGISDSTSLGSFNGDDAVTHFSDCGCVLDPGKDTNFTINSMIGTEGALGFYDYLTTYTTALSRTVPNLNRMYLTQANPILFFTFHPTGIDCGAFNSKWNKSQGNGFAARFRIAHYSGTGNVMELALLVTPQKIKIWCTNTSAPTTTKLYANTMLGGNSTDGTVRNQYDLATLATGNTYVEISFGSSYKSSGYAIFGPYTLPTMANDPDSSAVNWTATTPTGTSVSVSAAIVTGTPTEQDYFAVTNGGSLTGISASDSGKNLYFKVDLATTDTSVTPTLTSLDYEIIGQSTGYLVMVILTEAGRMKHPQGQVTIDFTGSLSGPLGSVVAPFSESFTPTIADPIFNPHDAENISISVTATPANIKIYYEEYQIGSENISLSVSTTGERIHINDLEQ